MKRLGIVGGLGPETSCQFFLNVNNKIIKETRIQPEMIMENVPMSEVILEDLAHGKKPSLVFNLLKESVIRLNKIHSDIIVIPCNTVHIFINQLRIISRAPILSIIEESAKECVHQNFKKIGVLASTTSIKERLHLDELRKFGIQGLIPTVNQQEEISQIIIRLVTNKVGVNDKDYLNFIIKDLQHRGADSILLACTDLRMIISPLDVDLPIVETTTVLENAVVKLFLNT